MNNFLLIFILASITDALDGRFARKFNVESKFGEFLDPLADKMLILSAFILFLTIDLLGDAVKPWMVALIFFRDLLVTVLRIIIKRMGLSMITSRIAKLKTAFQLISITQRENVPANPEKNYGRSVPNIPRGK